MIIQATDKNVREALLLLADNLVCGKSELAEKGFLGYSKNTESSFSAICRLLKIYNWIDPYNYCKICQVGVNYQFISYKKI